MLNTFPTRKTQTQHSFAKKSRNRSRSLSTPALLKCVIVGITPQLMPLQCTAKAHPLHSGTHTSFIWYSARRSWFFFGPGGLNSFTTHFKVLWQKKSRSRVRTHDNPLARRTHLPLHHARAGSVPRNAVFKQRVHSQLSNAFLRGCAAKYGKTDDAIVFRLKNCSRYDKSYQCHSWTCRIKFQKTTFSGHFFNNFRLLFTPEISIFWGNSPLKSCLESVKL